MTRSIGVPKTMPNNMLDGAQVIVDYLIRQKVPYAFGLCGHGNIQFIDALFESQRDIKTISVHHESVCGFMADVYYRVSGQPVATFTSCGPGSCRRGLKMNSAPCSGLSLTEMIVHPVSTLAKRVTSPWL